VIRELLRVEWISLRRDRAALFLTFVLPIVFFSIFSLVLGSMDDDVEEVDLRVLVVDLDDSEVSRSLTATLASHEALTVSTGPEPRPAGSGVAGAPDGRWSLEAARDAVRRGDAEAAIVLPTGLGETFGDFEAAPPRVELLHDAANPMARHTISGLLQAAAFESSPGLLMEKGVAMFERFGGPLTPQQRQAVSLAAPFLSGASPTAGSGRGLLEVAPVAAHDEESGDEEEASVIAYYAAGIAVMFLLFSMTGAAGGLLEEEERGTLERLLTSNVDMTTLLGSRFAFFTVMGLVQVLLMFVWGWAVFGLELWTANRVLGVLAMSLVTAAAAAGFGLVLAAACRSRAQLGGLSTIVVLVMSALGGSMMPRFLMPDFMKTVSRLTLNGWALDGFLEVFWYGDPAAGPLASLWSLRLELAVLAMLSIVFFLAARRLARRWEVV
jgi:ABC-2 type transport system permease protein